MTRSVGRNTRASQKQAMIMNELTLVNYSEVKKGKK